MVEAYAQTTTFGLCGRTFEACGLVPWCPDHVLVNPDVRDCLRDAELEEIAAQPTLLHTGSSVLTSGEFKARRARHIADRRAGNRLGRASLDEEDRVTAEDDAVVDPYEGEQLVFDGAAVLEDDDVGGEDV
jgi:hypothetical protein